MSGAPPADLTLRASSLLGYDVCKVERISGSGNNEIFRLDTPRGALALKRYIVSPNEGRDRIGQEFGALAFLAGIGEAAIPRPVACDRAAQFALYEWIDGESIANLRLGDLDAALAFIARLRAYGERPGARDLPPAVEACVDAPALRIQIAGRLQKLLDVATGEPQLAAFLQREFLPVWQRIEPSIALAPLPGALQILSPSDFGTHNMLRRIDGRLTFLDFEYFGWDDPAKLVADVFWHPGSVLQHDERQRFVAGAQHIFGDDPGYAARLALLAPPFGLRWALIVLSEFIPERWERRRRANRKRNWPDVKRQQLAKARDLVVRSDSMFALRARAASARLT